MRATRWTIRLLVALLVLGVTGAASAFEYKVRPGDTLMSIAEKQLGSSKRWKEIAYFNNISTPEQLRVGQVLQLPDDGPAEEEPVEPHKAVVPLSNAPRTVTPTSSRATPATATRTESSASPAMSAPTTETQTPPGDGRSLVSIYNSVRGAIAQHGLIAIVLAAGLMGMFAAWIFSIVTPRNLFALGFVFLVITAALFFVVR